MRRACDLVELAEAGVASRMQPAGEDGELLAAALALAVGRVAIEDGRRDAAMRALIAQIDSLSADLGPARARSEHRHRRVVGMDHATRHHVLGDQLTGGLEQPGEVAEPIGRLTAIDVDAAAGIDLCLAIERKMVAELLDVAMCARKLAPAAVVLIIEFLSWWSTTPFGWWRGDGSLRAHMLGYKIGMLAEAITRSLDLDHHSVVQEPIKKGCGDDRVAEHLAPLGEAAVGGEDHCTLLVAGIYELEEQVGAAGGDRKIPDLIDDQEGCAAQIAKAFAQLPIPLGLGQRGDDVGERGEVDAATGLHSLDSERGCQVALARAGRAKQMDDFSAINETSARRAPGRGFCRARIGKRSRSRPAS
jgi:hypothetical protein